jgi:glycosyltransferase involved in cell wall biosynthesis
VAEHEKGRLGMQYPLVSVIIPYYNGQRFISQTIESLRAQEYPNLEIIIVNDGSPADSLDALEPYRHLVTIIDQKNHGVAAARNIGIKAARGSIIGLIDQDDMWPAGRLSMSLEKLGDYDYVRGHTQAFQDHTDGTRSSSDPTFLPVLFGAALYKRHVFDIVGYVDEKMQEGDDFDWNVRLNESTLRGTTIPGITLLYRKHEENRSLNEAEYVKNGIMATLRRKLERSRSNQS